MAFDLVKFNKQVWTMATETLGQDVEKFNAQSNGVITLSAKPFEGDFDIEASFRLMGGLVRHRDVNNGTKNIDSTRLAQHKRAGVKIAAGTPEILWEQAQYAWVQKDQAAAAVVIGEQLAKSMMADMLNTAIKGGAAAIKGNTKAFENGAKAVIDFSVLTKAASRFGDRSSSIAAWVMHSGALTQLQLNALGNNERLFSFDTVNVLRDPYGRLFIVTDSPDLMVDETGIKYNTLGLTAGGIAIGTQNDFNSVIVPKTGSENIVQAYQAEWSYGLQVKGYGWKESAGANPNSQALATSTNWEQVATDIKDTAGVLIQTKG